MNKITILILLIICFGCSKTENHKPKDFDVFWSDAISELDDIPINEKLVFESSIKNNKMLKIYQLSSYQNQTIFVKIAEPIIEGKFPIKVRFSGMGKGSDRLDSIPNMWFLKEQNTINMTVDVRGQGLSTETIKYDQHYLTTQFKDIDNFILKGIYLDAIRAIQLISKHPKSNGKILVLGGSQGGTLALVSASLIKEVSSAVIGFPFLTDVRHYDKKQWPMNQFIHSAKRNNMSYHSMFKNLSYFDMLNFSDKITIPVFLKSAEIDPITPLNGVIKLSESLKNPMNEFHISPCEGHGCVNQDEGILKAEKLFISHQLNSLNTQGNP